MCQCSGEMHRYDIEHQLRRQSGYVPLLTLMARKRGERTGLDTLVVHALNDATLDVWFVVLQ